MERIYKLGVIGAGFMSSAIIGGIISSGFLPAESIIVSDVNDVALENMQKKGVNVTKNNLELCNTSEFVLFAVKPQSFATLSNEICGCSCEKFISIMAGLKKEKIKNGIGNINVRVARCMPNTPCSIGKGAVGVDLSDYSDEQDKKFITGLLSSFAKVVSVGEDKLNAVTGISGSSPAYFYLFVKGLVDAGVKHGLSFEESKSLATATMIGAGEMINANPDKSLEDLINAVCSKGGTTIEAVNTFNNNGLGELIESAVDSCVKRSAELENL